MKKILAILGLMLAIKASALTLSTNITSSVNGVFLLSTNGMSVYSVEITGAYPANVVLYDMDSIAAPYYGTNYTTSAWTGRTSSLVTNATSFVGYNGYTNWYTNITMQISSQANAAATNNLPPMGSFAVSGGSYAVYNTDIMLSRGLCVLVNTNVSLVINYRTGK